MLCLSSIKMTLTDRNKAYEVAKGDDILEKYIEEADKVVNDDNFLREAYDHELSMIEATQEEGHYYGFEAGKEEGIRIGTEKRTIEIAKKLLDRLSKEEISQMTGLSLEDIEHLKTQQTLK